LSFAQACFYKAKIQKHLLKDKPTNHTTTIKLITMVEKVPALCELMVVRGTVNDLMLWFQPDFDAFLPLVILGLFIRTIRGRPRTTPAQSREKLTTLPCPHWLNFLVCTDTS